MKNKWIPAVLFLILILFAIQSLWVSAQVDSTNILPDTIQETFQTTNPAELDETVRDAEETEKTRSNLLLQRDVTGGFSMITIFRGLLGMLVLIGIAWIFSTSRKSISWKVVLTGLTLQVLLALGVLYVPFIQFFFEFAGKLFVKVLDFTNAGVDFLFASMVTGRLEDSMVTFAIKILPTIVFFSALTSLFFYLGIIQKIVYSMAWVMTKLMKLSGAESLSVAGNIFLGQTESPLMIKEYLDKMNKSEMLLVMMGGMATLAGGVLAVYIDFLGGDDPLQKLLFAKHLLTASVMAAPGAIVISKILVPQTEDINKTIEVSKENVGSNVLDAISNGTGQG
ncbi:MAG: Na+ dependent nucleoside transporter N-terminal domain-containing protein, partial [Bacteroidales bacterium]